METGGNMFIKDMDKRALLHLNRISLQTGLKVVTRMAR